MLSTIKNNEAGTDPFVLTKLMKPVGECFTSHDPIGCHLTH